MLAEGAAGVLSAVFGHGRVLDRELDGLFRANPKWGKRDRAFVAETAFEVTRWRRVLAFLAGDPSVPALCAVHWQRSGYVVPADWPIHPDGVIEREAELVGQPRAVRESVPDWLAELGERELGEAWNLELAALNRRAPVFLRVNRLRGETAGAIDWLCEHGIEAARVPGAEDALVLPPGKMLPRPLVADGRVEIQDAGSQQIAPLLDVEPGMTVIDACAGAGGKTLHLASLMQGVGEIVALDISAAKLEELRRRAERAKVRIIRTSTWGDGTLRRYAASADRVLIDAPCSGLGTLRRQPDLKWRLTAASLEKTRRLQCRLLDQYQQLLRPGGKLVYATCSVLPSENGGQIRSFLERNPHLHLDEEVSVSPTATGWDGFYAARLG